MANLSYIYKMYATGQRIIGSILRSSNLCSISLECHDFQFNFRIISKNGSISKLNVGFVLFLIRPLQFNHHDIMNQNGMRLVLQVIRYIDPMDIS